MSRLAEALPRSRRIRERVYGRAFAALALGFALGCAHANGPLWRAESANGSAVLLGSVHAGSAEMYPLSQFAESGFATADRLVVEADITAFTQAELADAMRKYGMFTDGGSLEEAVGPELWARASEALQSIGMPPAASRAFRPWMAAVTLGTVQVMQSGYSEELGVDVHFLKKAHEQGKTILELETLEQQLSAFDGIPPSEQKLMLGQSLDDFAAGKPLVDALFEAWKNGDEQSIDESMNERILANGAVAFEKLIVERNRNMADRLAGELAKGGALFVVVGAAHLVGERSIVSMLRKRGIEVARIP